MRFGTWNVSSLSRVGSITAAARELARYKLDLLGVQEVRWDKRGMVREARCSHIETFISTPEPLLMGRLTTRLITY